VSKQRQRARAEQEARQRAAQRAKTAQKKAGGSTQVRPQDTRRKDGPGRAKRKGKQPVYRQRRFPPLPIWLKLSLAFGWLAVQVLIWFTVESIGTRIALAIISLFALPLIVVLVRDPSRRTKR
jgi:hypothetical protein